MTYGEVIDTITAYTKRKQNTLKERALLEYKLADLIATNVARLIDKDVQVPTVTEAYTFLFEEEEKKRQEDIRLKNEMEIWKQRMIGFARNHNRKRGES